MLFVITTGSLSKVSALFYKLYFHLTTQEHFDFFGNKFGFTLHLTRSSFEDLGPGLL